jgi:hypothetical protein
MPRAYWKGYLRLSLVACPIELFPATSQRKGAFSPDQHPGPGIGCASRWWTRVGRETRDRILGEKVATAWSDLPWSDLPHGKGATSP